MNCKSRSTPHGSGTPLGSNQVFLQIRYPKRLVSAVDAQISLRSNIGAPLAHINSKRLIYEKKGMGGGSEGGIQ